MHVLVPPGRALGRRTGLVIHQRNGAPTGRLAGQLITMPAWTAIEVARTLPRPRALATLDAALRTGRCTSAELMSALGLQRGRRGTAALAELVVLADGRSESPMESETRLVLLDGHLPPPALQHPVLDQRGREHYRLDLAWPWAEVAVEYDGFDHHSSPADLRRDRARSAWLLDHGWTVLRVTAIDVRRNHAVVVARVRRLLARSAHTAPAAPAAGDHGAEGVADHHRGPSTPSSPGDGARRGRRGTAAGGSGAGWGDGARLGGRGGAGGGRRRVGSERRYGSSL